MKQAKPKRQKNKPRAVTAVAVADTDKVCQNCVYYGVDGTCRRSAPLAGLYEDTPMTYWPAVAATDWCAQGYSHTADWYEPAPRRAPRD